VAGINWKALEREILAETDFHRKLGEEEEVKMERIRTNQNVTGV